MAKERKATGDATKKRTSRKTPVAAAQQATQQSPENGNVQTINASSNGGSERTNGGGEDLIRQRAYELCKQRGCEHGRDADDWFRAESEVRGKAA